MEETIEKTGRWLITCDKGEVFAHPIWRVYDSNMKLQNLYMARIPFINLTLKQRILLENLDIDFKSFYNYTEGSHDEVNKAFTNKDTVIKFIMDKQ
jgi:hypothetical protein